MWSRSDLRSWLTRPFVGKNPNAPGNPDSCALGLHFDDLVAMRGRQHRFDGRLRIVGFRFGDRTGRRRGTGLELDGIGPYQWGDDVRLIDWFATARVGRPQVKQFRHDVQQTVILVVDLRPTMMFGSSQQLMAKTACLAAAKMAWSTSKDHQPLGLLLIGKEAAEFIPARRGRRARLRCLDRIVRAYHEAIIHVGEPSPSLAERLEALPRHMSGDVEAVIVSDFSQLGDGFDRCLREAGARGALSAVLIEDGLMTEPPPDGLYPFRPSEDRRLAMVAIRKRDTNVYRTVAERHRLALMARLASLEMRRLLISDPRSIREGYFR